MNIFMFTDDSSLEVSFLEHTGKEMLFVQAAASLCCYTGQVYQFFVCTFIYQKSPMFQDFITGFIICHIPDF